MEKTAPVLELHGDHREALHEPQRPFQSPSIAAQELFHPLLPQLLQLPARLLPIVVHLLVVRQARAMLTIRFAEFLQNA